MTKKGLLSARNPCNPWNFWGIVQLGGIIRFKDPFSFRYKPVTQSNRLPKKTPLQAAPSVSSNSSPKHLWRHHNHDPYPIISARLSQPTGEPTGEWKSHEIPRLILISSPRIHATTRLSLFKGALFRRNVNLCFFNISWRWNNSLVGYILHHTWSIYQNTGW